ncbi:hypothetical protein ACI2LF_27610 [Kribbella sp. NPDC020789]
MTDNTIDLLRRIDPVATSDLAGAVSPEARADLLGGITSTAALTVVRKKRRRVVPLLAAAASVAALSFGVLQVPDGKGGQQPVLGPALAFATEGKTIKIRVLDAQAESARFNQELKAHGLNITLELQPASPALVGAKLSAGYDFTHSRMPAPTPPPPGKPTVYDPFKTRVYPADCYQTHVPCVPEFTIPLNYPYKATLVFGRAAKPGERYLAATNIDRHGEVLEGVRYEGRTIAQVTKMLADRGRTVEYLKDGTYDTPVRNPPKTWKVAVGLAANDHHVKLFVRR